MAVALVSDSESNTSAAGTSITRTGVAGSTGDLLVVGISYETGSNPGTTITGVTYGATSMTEAVFIDAHACAVAIYYLASPAGTEDVVASFSASVTRILINAAIFSGTNTSAPISDVDEVSIDSPATTGSVTLTTAADDMLYDCLCRVGNDQAGTVAGANQTQLATFGSGTSNRTNKMSYQDGADGGVMSWDVAGGMDGALCAVNIAAAAAGGGSIAAIARHYRTMKQ
jgi:hypothetical protein